jgi:hypothetical protein
LSPVASSPRVFSASFSCATVIVLGSVIVKSAPVGCARRLRGADTVAARDGREQFNS